MHRRNHSLSSSKKQLRAILENLVIPVFNELAYTDEEGSQTPQLEQDEKGTWTLCALLDGGQLVWVTPVAIDHERTLLRFTLAAGVFLDHMAEHALILGSLLEDTFFHVRLGSSGARRNTVDIGCDLVVRADDTPLVSQRVFGIAAVGYDLEMFCALHMPERLRRWDLLELEQYYGEHLSENPTAILDKGLNEPQAKQNPYQLMRLAQGLGRWRDLIQLLHDHADGIPTKISGRFKSMAYRELGKWQASIRAAHAAGIKEGRYEGDAYLDPAYLHALIEGEDEIEALRILGEQEEGEPFFYAWLRGTALHKAGDIRRGNKLIQDYLANYPGDLFALVQAEELSA
ncbi:MAG: hypothetical protein H7A51_19340 [Akkermansiaceae bacterium]|nr:hypothetical protein [Akkermansiaceae bacterium]